MSKHYERDTRRQSIYNEVVSNPGCTAHDVAAALGIETRLASSELSQIRRSGRLSAQRVAGDPLTHWFVRSIARGPALPDSPCCIILKTWMPCTVRDPLITAFFGVAA